MTGRQQKNEGDGVPHASMELRLRRESQRPGDPGGGLDAFKAIPITARGCQDQAPELLLAAFMTAALAQNFWALVTSSDTNNSAVSIKSPGICQRLRTSRVRRLPGGRAPDSGEVTGERPFEGHGQPGESAG
jgi:hypothetical protein